MKIIFYLKYSTHFGESLYITGNMPELGAGEDLVEMQYFNNDYWRIELDIVSQPDKHALLYKYVFKGTDGALTYEFQQSREILLGSKSARSLKVYDVWNFAGSSANAFCTAPFQKVLLPVRTQDKVKTSRHHTQFLK